MSRHRLSALFFMLAGAVLALVLIRSDSARAIGDTLAAANQSLGPSTAFTYQGELQMDGVQVSGTYDFQFSLWDAASGGSQTGSTVSHADVTVDDGRFTVLLDFGDVFDGNSYYLEIAVRPANSTEAHTTLSPRQALTAVPYASYAGSVPWSGVQDLPNGFADGVDDVDGVAYANVLVVAKSGGSFALIQAALDSITDAAADNPYLVWVAPGVYEEQVTLKPYVTLEGAGEGATIVRGDGGDHTPYAGADSATLIGADNATVRHLTVESTGNTWAVAIYNFLASPTLVHVTATATSGSWSNIGVFSRESSPTLTNVTVTATDGSNNYGVYNYTASSPVMTNVMATASGGGNSLGVYNDYGSSPTMTNVTATATSSTYNAGVFNNGGSSPTMTNVTATASGGSDTNYGVYNEYGSPTMTDVTATASGSGANYGVYNDTFSPTMTDVTATASDGSANYGVYNEYGSPTMTDVTATASGGSGINAGVFNTASSPTMTNVTATATGGNNNYGVYNDYVSSPVIRDSRLEGITNSVVREDSYSVGQVAVANSQLIGPVEGGATCYNNYDENLAPVTCNP